MLSLDKNLNNPMKVDKLEVEPEYSSWKHPIVKRVSQTFYDLLKIKDPNTIYIITDSPNHLMYFGDHEISDYDKNGICRSPEYVMGVDSKTQEYVIYLNAHENRSDHLVEIERYKSPDIALKKLSVYMNTMGCDIRANIYKILKSYIRRDHHNGVKLISTNQCIIGIISLYYPQESMYPLLRAIGTKPTIDDFNYEIPVDIINWIKNLRLDSAYCNLKTIYINLYVLFRYLNFFVDVKYSIDIDKLDLNDEINKIQNIFKKSHV